MVVTKLSKKNKNSVAKISGGTVHNLPPDFKKALSTSMSSIKTWESITPLARNEWICWATSVKTKETGDKHIKRAIEDLAKGKRRPCCWYGCVHRKDKEISASVRWVLENKVNKSINRKPTKR